MSAPKSALRRHAPKVLASLGIAALFVWLFRRGGLPLVPGPEALASLTAWGVAGYTVLLLATMWLRTYRWVYLLRPLADVDTRRVVGVGFLGFGAILFGPLRMGEVVRPYLIASDDGVGFTEATGTVLAERVIDGLVISFVLLAGLLLSHPVSPLPDHLGSIAVPVHAIPGAAWTALTMFGGAFTAMALFYFARDFARKITHAVLDLVSAKLATWVTGQIERLADSLKFLSSAHGVPFLRDTLLYWTVSTAAIWVALRGCGIAATPAEACLTAGVCGLGSLIPSGPGMFGTYQLATYAALAMFCPESVVLTAGAAFVFLTYSVQLVSTLAGVGLGYWLVRRSAAHPATKTVDTP
jgi:hypothetical protein